MNEKKQGWTPEPWKVECIGNVWYCSAVAGEDVARVCPLPGDDGRYEARANAARIVSCVNACAGIENPEAVKELVEAAIAAVHSHCYTNHGDMIERLCVVLAKLGVK